MPDDKKDPKKKVKGKSFRRFDAAKLLTAHLRGNKDDFDEVATKFTRKQPSRVNAKLCYDSNSKAWYIKYVNVSPAANTERPMEPIFNVSFNPNGTLGVPKFVELDVEWVGFADTFMMDQVSFSALQQIRKAMKSNLTYDDKKLKACITNAIALAVYGKMLERDVHWNLYSGSEDFNFSKMFKYQNQTVGTYGVVPLYPKTYLLDENLPYTSTIYNEIVSLFNQVLKLPSRISEFISHYFGTLFTLDKDGHNDQYLKVNMHEIDYYEDGDPTKLVQLDLSNLTLDDYLELLNSYSKTFAVIIADLEKCLGVNQIRISRYDEYTYAFVYDKSLLQALINGYTDSSAVKNNYIRLDKMPGVDDDLTQFIFMGGVQPIDASKASVKAIKILDMVLKINSDNNIQWPSNIDQTQILGANDQTLAFDDPIGFSIVTEIITDDDIFASVTTSGSVADIAIPTYPELLPANTAISNKRWSYGASAKTTFPASDFRVQAEINNISQQNIVGLLYLGSMSYVASGTIHALFTFAAGTKNCGGILDPWTKLSREYSVAISLTDNSQNRMRITQIDNIIRSSHVPDNFFFYVHVSTQDAEVKSHILSCWPELSDYYEDFGALDFTDAPENNVMGLYVNPYGTARFDCHITAFRNFDYAQYNYTMTWHSASTWGSGQRIALTAHTGMGPAGLTSMRYAYAYVTVTNVGGTISGSTGGESLPMYVSQVVDYHLPMFYKRRYNFLLKANNDLVAEIGGWSLPTLLKEDYIPYYYNILDLIPVLYEMFVSLFSIDNIKRIDRR